MASLFFSFLFFEEGFEIFCLLEIAENLFVAVLFWLHMHKFLDN